MESLQLPQGSARVQSAPCSVQPAPPLESHKAMYAAHCFGARFADLPVHTAASTAAAAAAAASDSIRSNATFIQATFIVQLALLKKVPEGVQKETTKICSICMSPA